MTEHLRTYGPMLLDGSYFVLPIMQGEKRPALKTWQDARLVAGDLLQWPANYGVGVMCGIGAYPIAAIDIDVSHPAVLEAVLKWCREVLGVTCERIGAAPRILLTYRAAEAGWTKATSVSFFDPLDPTKPNGKPNEQRIEVLGVGQQFVAYHTHPDTQQPYQWTDLFGGIAYVPASELPIITQGQIALLLAEFERIVKTLGLAIKGRTTAVSTRVDDPDGDPFAGLTPRIGLTLIQAAAYLSHFANEDLEYDDWLNVGMALHHEFEGAPEALEMWRQWGATSTKNDPSQYGYKWESFAKSGHRPLTFAFIIKRAKECASKEKYAAQAEWKQKIAEAADDYALREAVCPQLARDIRLGEFEREALAQVLCDRFRALGLKMPIAQCRKIVARPAPNPVERMPGLEQDRHGRASATKDNLARALGNCALSGCQVQHDLFRDELMIAEPGTDGWRSFVDTDYFAVARRLETGPAQFEPIPKDLLRDAISYVASTAQFDAAQHWLTSLEWDGTPRVSSFLPRCFGADDTPYVRAVSGYLWTALAGRVMVPGIKADMVPVAVGAQGAGKSRSIAAISPAEDFFAELDLGARDDDTSRLMRGKLVIELGELRGLRNRERESLKAFITRTHEQWVPKFKEFAAHYPRRCIFIGSTNRDEFLVDDTGNRRWLPFRVSLCAPDLIERDRAQLWAEGRTLFLAHGVMWQDAQRLAGAEHEQFAEVDPWADRVAEWRSGDPLAASCPPNEPFTAEHALRFAIGLSDRELTKASKDRMAAVLKSLGFSADRAYLDGRRVRVYQRTA